MGIKANTYWEPPFDAQREVMNGAQFRAVVAKVNTTFPLPEHTWQPSDYIPSIHELIDSPKERTERVAAANAVPDNILACLVSNAITEFVLGNYTRTIERTFPSTEATDDHPMHRFGRLWAAEEDRHGRVLDRYLSLISRLNQGQIEQTTMTLNGAGFDMRTGKSVFEAMIYPTIQEYLTALAHANVGKLSNDKNLGEICRQISADEIRHQHAYHAFVSCLLEQDPVGVTTSFANLLRKGMVMPAEQMNTSTEPNLYKDFSYVAAQEGVLGPQELLKTHKAITGNGRYGLNLGSIRYTGEHASEAEVARSFLLDKYPRLLQIATDRVQMREKKAVQFSWIKN